MFFSFFFFLSHIEQELWTAESMGCPKGIPPFTEKIKDMTDKMGFFMM